MQLACLASEVGSIPTTGAGKIPVLQQLSNLGRATGLSSRQRGVVQGHYEPPKLKWEIRFLHTPPVTCFVIGPVLLGLWKSKDQIWGCVEGYGSALQAKPAGALPAISTKLLRFSFVLVRRAYSAPVTLRVRLRFANVSR